MNNMKNINKTLILAGLIIGFGLAFATPALAAAPIISSVGVSGITETTATLSAQIDPNGTTPTSGWFELSPTFTPVGNVNNINAIQTITYNATGLTCGTNYTFNVGAINSANQTMDSGNSFSTSPCPQPPDVTTAYNINTTQTQTDLAGSVNPNGASTTVWFEYQGNPICGNENIGNGTSAIAVTPCVFSGLQPNTSYIVTLNAASANGTDLMAINFSTLGVTPPSISNVTASGITQTAAILSAQINPNGSNSSGWFEVGPSYTPVGNVNNILSTQTITYNLSGLTCGTTYNFNAGAVNLGGQALKSAQFTTVGCGNSPTITTTAATNISASGATLNGTWNANGFATTTWFEYDTDGSAPFANSTTQIPQGLGSGTLQATISGLSGSTQYYFRACGSNAQGQNCGSVLNFTTSASGGSGGSGGGGGGGGSTLPSATTNSANSITLTSATLNGSWNGGSASTNTWFQYGTSSSNLNLSTSPVAEGTGSGSMAATLTGLTANTTYYFRAMAQNSYGTDTGSTLSFVTTSQASNVYECNDGKDNDNDNKIDLLDPGCSSSTDNDEYNAPVSNPNAPQALTSIATEKTKSSAKLNALIVIGASASTESWFEYGKTTALGQATIHQTIGSTGQIPFNQIVTSLEANTIYFFRAVAKNSYGTDPGNIMVFQTEANVVNQNNGSNSNSSSGSNSGSGTNTSSGNSSTAVDKITLNIETFQTEISAGGIANYTVTIKNEGGKNANAATLKVTLPKEVSFVSASEGSFNADTLVVNLGALNPGQEKKIAIEGRVAKNVKENNILLATANLVFTGVSGNPSDLLAYATHKVIEIPLEAAVSRTGAKTLGWFLIAIGIILLVILGRELYGKPAIRNLLASFIRKN